MHGCQSRLTYWALCCIAMSASEIRAMAVPYISRLIPLFVPLNMMRARFPKSKVTGICQWHISLVLIKLLGQQLWGKCFWHRQLGSRTSSWGGHHYRRWQLIFLNLLKLNNRSIMTTIGKEAQECYFVYGYKKDLINRTSYGESLPWETQP